jgi:hypothetical protein
MHKKFLVDNLKERALLFRQCGILNISQPYRLPRPVVGFSLLFICRQETYLRPSMADHGIAFFLLFIYSHTQ